MSDHLPIATNGHRTPVTRQARAIEGRSARGQVTGKLRRAIEAMVWEGSCRPDAATAAGLQDHSVREALRKPHVKAFYRAQLDVLRTNERARNIHALIRVRDQARNLTAAVAAVKALEQLKDDAAPAGTGQATAPGLVIQIIGNGAIRPPTIEG